MKKRNTNCLIMWEDRDGNRKWEAITYSELSGYVKSLLKDGVHPATIIYSYNPILFHWVFESYHNGLSDVFFNDINDKIYGNYKNISKHKVKKIETKESNNVELKYGWIAPDGRFFNCDYGGHRHLAEKIVGEINKIDDAEKYLEDIGWAKIYSGSMFGRTYCIGMGIGKKLTDGQIKKVIELNFDNLYGIEEIL